MKRFQIVLCISLFLLFLPTAKAQLGVYANFSAAHLTSPNAPWIYGPTLGAYYDGMHLPLVNFGADLRASILGSGGNTQVDSGMIGARAVIHAPLLPIKPYGEMLIGAAHVQTGQGFGATNKTAFEYAALGGADLTIFPRLDWRVVEYQYSWFAGGPQQQMLSTGLVFRVPIP
jgi:hypothetical protein